MLTADTITESHVRRVWTEHPNAITGLEMMAALNEPHIAGVAWTDEEVREAREKCCAILNRRCAKCGSLCDHASWNGADCPWCLKPSHTEPQSIPVVDEQTAALVALFEAALFAKPYDVTLSEAYQPGAGAALIAWARGKGLAIEERRYVTESQPPYANVRVRLSPANATIDVMAYRKLTADEIAAITVEERERKLERIGYGQAAL